MLVTSLLAGAAQREAHQQRHRSPGRALLAAALPGGAGDVEVRPTQLAREAREERRRGDGAAGPSADIRHVGEIGALPFLVFLPQRHLPDSVPGIFACRTQLVAGLLVVAEQAGGLMGEPYAPGA